MKQLSQKIAQTLGVSWQLGKHEKEVLLFPAKSTPFELLLAFSQDKDELILGFANENEQLYCKATLKSEFTCLVFPEDFARAKKNSVDLFPELKNRAVVGITQYAFERSFSIDFTDGFQLLFKMHAKFSNIILFENEQFVIAFHKKLENDRLLTLDSLDKTCDFSWEGFQAAEGNYSKLLPTLGKDVKVYLEAQGIATLPAEQQWTLLQKTVQDMESGNFYLLNPEGLPTFTLLPPQARQEGALKFTDAFAALQEFYIRYTYHFSFHHEQQTALKALQKRLKQVQSYLDKTLTRLFEVEDSALNEQTAHIIMANLHQLPAGVTEIELYDFYKDAPRKIKLKKDLTPQKTAEQYYRKAKNEKIERDTLQRNIARKEKEVKILQGNIEQIQQISVLKSLRKYLRENHLEAKEQEKQENSLFRKFHYLGWDIWVGKNAKNNDVLTQQYARKDDLWLHAKDVSGSHVVIKAQAGKAFPSNVIEKAATLAAFYSKRSNDTLCPVLYTPRKYVRKTRDLAAGQVIVEKEEVIMVVPERF